MKNYKKQFIIAIDPSGNWYEGKGITGWCVYHAADDKIIRTGNIYAEVFPSQDEYWEAHLQLLEKLFEKYGLEKTVVVLEDYLLYSNRALAQTNSRMETSQLLGILKHYCWQHNADYAIQPAGEVKTRWQNKILTHKKYIRKDGAGFRILGQSKVLTKHCLDAIRHAVHYGTFKNKEGVEVQHEGFDTP